MALVLECVKKENQQDYLLKYLMSKLAPVLVKLKPSGLLRLCNCEKSGRDNHYDLWKAQKNDITGRLGISFKELKGTSKGKQVLFYNPEILFDTITRPANLAYLEKFDYFSCNTVEDYLEVLKTRFCAAGAGNSSSFPHEIGIFLGYPLKDVRGFIEKGSLPLAKVGSWQVFGKPEESLRLMNMYKIAEEVFLNLIKNRGNPMPYIERLSAHFRRFAKDIIAVQVS